jgi:hypothetical protein
VGTFLAQSCGGGSGGSEGEEPVSSAVKSEDSKIAPSAKPLILSVEGNDAPNFAIKAGNATFEGLLGGAGLFKFKLTCNSGVMTVGANPSYNSFCPTVLSEGTLAHGASGVDVGSPNNFHYKLIVDPNGDGTLTLAQAQAAVASGTTKVTLSTDLLPGSTGFQTILLAGPPTLNANPKLILILQAKDPNNPSVVANSSFQYFPITIQTFNP